LSQGPRFIRSTMYTIPDNPDIKKQTGVPFGLVLCPMAEVLPGEYPPPIVNLGELGKISIKKYRLVVKKLIAAAQQESIA